MIDKLTRYFPGILSDNDDHCDMFSSNDGEWCDFDEVEELLAEQEKKTKILLDALEVISNLCHDNDECGGDSWCHVECAQEALEEYKR